jgi:hypothetical protein
VDHGFQRGYRRALTEVTGKVSLHVFRKQRFVECCSISYTDFTYQGQRCFGSIHEQERAILMEKSLVS